MDVSAVDEVSTDTHKLTVTEGREENATLSYREDLTEELAIFRVVPDSGSVTPFTAGQYAELAMPKPGEKLVRRPYSIASASSAQGYVEIFVVLVPDGYLTPQLWKMPLGARLWLGPKIKGKFTLDPVPTEKDIVMISTGTGLAPFISMLREYRGKGRWRKLVMIHCARLERDLGYRSELEAAAAEDSSIVYIPTVTREPAGSAWNGLRGRIQPILEPERYESLVGSELTPEECQVMLCGNPQMIDETQKILEARGFRQHSKKNPGHIHFERFW